MCTDLCSCSNSETGEACENVNMIENDSSDDETSDEQDDDSEEDEDDSYLISMFYRSQCIVGPVVLFFKAVVIAKRLT